MKRACYLLLILALAIVSCSSKKQATQPKVPNNPVAELKQADQLLIHKRCPEAISAYHKFLEKYPKDAQGWQIGFMGQPLLRVVPRDWVH